MTTTVNMIRHEITNLEHEDILSDSKSKFIQLAKIDTLYWLIQGNTLKTTDEIKTKIKRYEEELIALNSDIALGDTLPYEEKTSRIHELKKYL